MVSASGNRTRPIKVGNVGMTSSSIGQPRSAESHRKREPSFTGFFVLTVHLLGGLSHRGNGFVQTYPVPGFDLIAGDDPRCPCLDGAECTPLDTRDLHVPGDGVTCHSQMMLQC